MSAAKKEDTSHTMETPKQGTIHVYGDFVTVLVPVAVAMRVADNKCDGHYDAVLNLHQMLIQDMEEEYGIKAQTDARVISGLLPLLNEALAELRCSCHPPGTVLDDCLGTCVQAKLAKTIEIIQPNSEGESQ